MAQDNAVEVGKNHKRAIGATLTLLDEMLCELRNTPRAANATACCTTSATHCRTSSAGASQAEVAAMRGTMRELKEALRLTASRDEAAQQIWGRASAFWEVLVETQSRYLRRYGELTPGLKECLDPRIKALTARLLALVELSRNAASGPSAPAIPSPKGKSSDAGKP